MAATHHKKQQITAVLTALRVQVQNEAALLRRKFDIKRYFLGSIKIIRWKWPVLPLAGWLLSNSSPERVNIESSTQSS